MGPIGGYYSVVLTGANLHIRNGLGATSGNPGSPFGAEPGPMAVNGLGNLIIGYNESRSFQSPTFFAHPAKHPHFAWAGSQETVVQVHGVGPTDLTFVDPADDPRGKK